MKKTRLPIVFAFVFVLISAAAAGFLIYVNGVDLFPAQSRRPAFLAIFFFWIFFFLLTFFFRRSLFPRLNRLSARFCLISLFVSAACAFYLLVWLPLPLKGLENAQTLNITPIIKSEVPQRFNLTWFNTPRGDISFSSLRQEGVWTLNENGLSTVDPKAKLSWQGHPGEKVTLEFGAGENAPDVLLSWNNRERLISLYNREMDRLSYEFFFPPANQFWTYAAAFWLLTLCGFAILILAQEGNLFFKRRLPWAIIALFIGFRLLQFYQTNEVLTLVDTNAYIGLSKMSLSAILSGETWSHSVGHSLNRPILIPLFFKLCGQNYQKIALMNLVISIFSWAALAISASACFRSFRAKTFVLVGISGLGSCANVTRWDRIMMSESLTISLLILTLASWLWMSHDAVKSGAWSILKMAVFALVALLAALTRDSSVWTIATFIPVLIAISFAVKSRKAPLTLAALLCAICLFSMLMTGERWKYAYYNNLFVRILPDSRANAFFTREGMPEPSGLETLYGVEHVQEVALFNSPEFEPLRNWVLKEGKQVYLRYLLTKLGDTLREPWAELYEKESFIQTGYRYAPKGFVSLLPPSVERVFLLNLPGVLCLMYCLVILWKTLPQSEFFWLWLPAFMVLTAYALGVLVYASDSYDIERHFMAVSLPMKAALWVLAGYAMESANQVVHPFARTETANQQ